MYDELKHERTDIIDIYYYSNKLKQKTKSTKQQTNKKTLMYATPRK